MKIWITRHGQTNLNKQTLMQGLTDEPLNDVGIQQAREARKRIGDVKFDAVYSSPLDRAIVTAAIIGNVNRDDVITDPRIIEMDFGKFELCNYFRMGPAMSFYWIFPDKFRAPDTVETMDSMLRRSSEFLKELEQKDYNNVLVSAHGGIMRVLCGYLADRQNGIYGRGLPKNCEINVFESVQGKHRFLKSYVPTDK